MVTLATRYRGKPGDVGLVLFGLRPNPSASLEESGAVGAVEQVVTHRLLLRKSFDGRGASFAGQSLGLYPSSLCTFNMFVSKIGPGSKVACVSCVSCVIKLKLLPF